jgi:hypothetical protein
VGHRRASWKPWFEERIDWRGSHARGNACEGEPHPMRHISALQCHEWMLRDCAALELARQQREDSIVATITNVSAAALLAIPGLLFSKDLILPSFEEGSVLYLGYTCFLLAFSLAVLEQVFSTSAYEIQADISKAYYRLESLNQSDSYAVWKVTFTRKLCIWSFCLALLLSAIGFGQVRSNNNGRPDTPAASTPAAAPSTAAAAPSTAAAAPSTAAAASTSNDGGLRERSEVSAGGSSVRPSEAVKFGN